MSTQWLDILKERLGKRRYQAQPEDWSQMEQLLNQHLPLPSSGSAAGGAGSSFLSSSIAQWAIAGLLVFGHAASDQQHAPLVDFPSLEATPSLQDESSIPSSQPASFSSSSATPAITNEPAVEATSNHSPSDSQNLNEWGNTVAEDTDQESTVESPSASATERLSQPNPRSSQTAVAYQNETGQEANNASNSSNAETAKTASSGSIEEAAYPSELTTTASYRTEDLSTLPLWLTKNTAQAPSSPLGAPTQPDQLLSKPFALRLGIDALRLETGVLPNNGWFYGLGLEWEKGQQLFGIGLGMAQEYVPLTGDEWVNQMELNSYQRWEVDTLYDRHIDTTWVIAGINQGYWRIDTFYTGRLDSVSITEYDTAFTQMLQPYRQTISLQSYVLPLRYAWRFPQGRWDHRLGVQGQIGFTERVDRLGDREIQLERQFRYAVGLDLGTDYYLLENWALGLSWNPQYRAFGDARLEDAWQWEAFRFHLRWRF